MFVLRHFSTAVKQSTLQSLLHGDGLGVVQVPNNLKQKAEETYSKILARGKFVHELQCTL